LKRVLVTGARAPVALDLARAFRAAGCQVALADSVRPFAASLARPLFPIHRLPPPRFAFARFRERMKALAELHDLIVPTCEEVFWLAEAAERDGWAERLFAPGPAMLRRLHSKVDFPGFARAAGVDAPSTRSIASRAELEALGSAGLDLVLKPEFSRFGTRTLIAPRLSALSRIEADAARRWVAQERIAGEEYCVWSAARKGRLVASVVYRPLLRQGPSACYAFEAVDRPAIVEMAERIAASVGEDGQFSFDVIVTPEGRVAPLECNPRAVSGVHLFDASAALARALMGEGAMASPASGSIRFLSPALALMGVPRALATGSFRELRRAWSGGSDAVGRPGDRLPVAGVLLDAARFAMLSLLRRRSPTGETTDDIEWNGEAMP
jgi:hypothetical protein